MTPTPSTANFDSLAEETYLKIFKKFDVTGLLAAGQVCKKWRLLINDEILWKKLAIKKIPFLPKIDGLQWRDHFQLNFTGAFSNKIYTDKELLYSFCASKIVSWKKRDLLPNTTMTETYHSHSITCALIRKLGTQTTIFTGSADKTIKIWIRTNIPHVQFGLQQILDGHDAPISAMATINNHLAAASLDGKIILWSFREEIEVSYKKYFEFSAHARKVTVLHFAKRAPFLTLFSGSTDKTIKIWSLINKKIILINTLCAHSDTIGTIEYNQKQNLLMSAARDGQIILWSGDNFQHLSPQQVIQAPPGLIKVAFCERKKIILIGNGNQKIDLWNKDKKEKKWKLKNTIQLDIPYIDFVNKPFVYTAAKAEEIYIFTPKYVITYLINRTEEINEISRIFTQFS